MHAIKWLMIGTFLIASPASAQQQIETLSCTFSDPNDAPAVIIVDFSARTACLTMGGSRCVGPNWRPSPATITDQLINFNSNISINRITGIITWADGKPGRCTLAKQRF